MRFVEKLEHVSRALLAVLAVGALMVSCSHGTDPQGLDSYKTVTWKGHTWNISDGKIAGFIPAARTNVVVDGSGDLHLNIVKAGNSWSGSEVFSRDLMGFGTYQWQVKGPVDVMDPSVVFGLFPYGPAAGIGEDGTNELDVEFSRWNDPENPHNVGWTFWPNSGSNQGFKEIGFSLNGGNTCTVRMIWTGTQVVGQLLNGYKAIGDDSDLLGSYTYAPADPLTDIPQQPMPLGMCLRCFHAVPASGNNLDIAIHDFQFVPAVTYTISASAGTGGSISPKGTLYLTKGSDQTFTITPSPGFDLKSVTVDGSDQGKIAQYTFHNVQANHTIAASFEAAAGDTNIAAAGTGNYWDHNTDEFSNANKVAEPRVNDGDASTSFFACDSDEGGAANWEAAGVIFTGAKTISSVVFVNGDMDKWGNGFLEHNCEVQVSTDGTTWTASGWTCTPAYPYTADAAGQTYSFAGTAISGVVGVRVAGQPGGNSYRWAVKEVQIFGH